MQKAIAVIAGIGMGGMAVVVFMVLLGIVRPSPHTGQKTLDGLEMASVFVGAGVGAFVVRIGYAGREGVADRRKRTRKRGDTR